MTLENKCHHHWQALEITNTESLKDFITTLFTKHDHQEKVLIDLYKLVFPEWDCITKIEGYPEAGCDLWRFICRLFQEFDRKHHPGCIPGGAWMNTGFSVNHEIGAWEISFENCHVKYTRQIQSNRR